MDRRVAVTGLGLVTPLGLDVTSTWQSLLGGVSGVATTTGLPGGVGSTRSSEGDVNHVFHTILS